MPALQKAKPANVANTSLTYQSVELPRVHRETRVEKNMSAEEVASEIAEWLSIE
jgi:hypothetical protein